MEVIRWMLVVDSQYTCPKAESDAELGLFVHLKFPDDSCWQCYESRVGKDVENARIRPESILQTLSNWRGGGRGE